MENCNCELYFLGMIPYPDAQRLQEKWAGEIAAGQRSPSLLLLEHPHTYTIGRSGKLENLLLSPQELDRRCISLYWTDRGGDITYHGPGQLVGYPLLSLANEKQITTTGRIPKNDYIGYIRKLEEVIILVLKHLGIPAQRIHGQTGVWVQLADTDFAKIASIGIKVDAKGISRHGFSLNVSPDMSYWNDIIPCGVSGTAVTSIEELLRPGMSMQELAGMQTVMKLVVDSFSIIFGCSICEVKYSQQTFQE